MPLRNRCLFAATPLAVAIIPNVGVVLPSLSWLSSAYLPSCDPGYQSLHYCTRYLCYSFEEGLCKTNSMFEFLCMIIIRCFSGQHALWRNVFGGNQHGCFGFSRLFLASPRASDYLLASSSLPTYPRIAVVPAGYQSTSSTTCS